MGKLEKSQSPNYYQYESWILIIMSRIALEHHEKFVEIFIIYFSKFIKFFFFYVSLKFLS